MNLKKISILIAMITAFSTFTNAQDLFSDNGITPGLRMGSNYSTWWGFSGRMNFDPGSFEVILTPGNNRFTITGLVAVHEPFSGNIDGLSYFYGLGAHVGLESNAVPIVGADAIAGVEYSFSNVPILISVDMKPALDIISSDLGFHWDQGAITVRYALGR